MFPVTITKTLTPYREFDDLRTAQDTDLWFIADRPHLKICFSGIVPILVIEASDVSKMSFFLDSLGLQHRLLSKIASGTTQASSGAHFNNDLTKTMRLKAKFISRLLPDDAKREALAEKLYSAVMYGSEQITIEWTIKSPKKETIVGRSDSGSVKMQIEGKHLAIYIANEHAASGSFPIELMEYISEFCEIKDKKSTMLLQYALMESDLQKIADAFLRHGILENEFESGMEQKSCLDKNDMFYPKQPLLNAEEEKALKLFLDDVEKATSVNKITSRRWEQNKVSQLKPFLSRICSLEKQDVSDFLPQSDMDRVLGGSHRTNDKHEVAYFQSGALPDEELHSRTTLLFPAVVAVPKRGKPKFHLQIPALNELDPEMNFLGELLMSQLLEKHMQEAYRPELEWTSSLRTRAGFRPYIFEKGSNMSTFTLNDTSGTFTKLLNRSGYRGSIQWAAQRTFHLDLITVERGLVDGGFSLHPNQLKTARRCYIDSVSMERPSSIAVLAIVSDIYINPKISLFLNPWQLYVDNQLDILIESHSLARFRSVPQHIIFQPSDNTDVLNDSKYIYSSLGFKSFRLLQLQPGQEKGPLRGILSTHSINDKPTYRALSYTRGVNLKPYKLRVNNCTLYITSSLDTALRSIRELDKPVRLWVDAICIDQHNDHEKVSQIRLMRDIYQSAEFVYGFLGPKEDDSNAAIETLLQVRLQENRAQNWPADVPPIPSYWAGHTIPQPIHTVWGAIDSLFDRDWFKRVWIIQEIVFASDVVIVCGTRRTRWVHIFEALHICLRESQRLIENNQLRPGTILTKVSPAIAIGETRNLYSESPVKYKHSLLTLFDQFAHTKASLELDKIFGLLGLSSDADHDALSPYYSSSLESVVRRFASEFVVRGDAIELLYRAGDSKAYEFSSWIPAWTRRSRPCTIFKWHTRLGNSRACGDSAVYASVFGVDRKILTISGAIVDSIASISEVTLAESDVWTFVNSLYDLLKSMTMYPTGESLDQVRLMLPIGNASYPHLEKGFELQSNARMPSGGEDFEWIKTILRFSSIQSLLDFLRQPSEIRTNLWKYWRTVSAFALRLSYAKFFTTTRGYAGLAPAGAREGDDVVIFNGGAVPFITRLVQKMTLRN